MKKLLYLLLVVCVAVSFIACGGQPAAADGETSDGTSAVPQDTMADSVPTAENTAEEDTVGVDDAGAVVNQPHLPDGLTQLPMAPGEAYACEVWTGESSDTFSFSVMDYTVEPSVRDGYEVRTVAMLLASFDGADPYTEFVFFDLGENLNPIFDSGVVFRDGEELDFNVLSCETVDASAGFDHVVVLQTLSVEAPIGYEHIALVPMNFRPVGSDGGEFADLVNSDSLWFLLGTPTADGVSCGGDPLQFAAPTADTAQLYSYVDGPGAELGYGENYDEPVIPEVVDPVEEEDNWLTLNMERSMLEKSRNGVSGTFVGVQLVDDSDPAATVFRIVVTHDNLPADAYIRCFVYDSWDEYPIYEQDVQPGDGTTEITCVLNMNVAVTPLAFNAFLCGSGIEIPLCGVVEYVG